MKNLKKVFILLVMLSFSFSILTVKADETTNVAKVDEKEYASLDEAINAVKDTDNAVIELLSDATTEGLNLTKNLTIKSIGENHYTITFTKNGIALWGMNLTFENVDVIMENIGSTAYTAEWNWMTICASKNSSLNLIDTNMIMDGINAGNKHAIYFTGNDKLNLTDSNLTIKNYKQDALEWDGGDGGYNINIVNSTYVSDHNRSGITGTFVVTIDHSNVDVVNSTGNGSNGSHYEIKNKSILNYNNNGSHGLSAGNLTIANSDVTAVNNGFTGIIVNGKMNITNSNIYVSGTIGNSYWAGGLRLMANATGYVDENTTLVIEKNEVSGIFMSSGSKLEIATGAKVKITENKAFQEHCSMKKEKAQMGGGIFMDTNTTAILPTDIELYNNHANLAGDDIYVSEGSNITFGEVGSNWYLDGEPDCIDKINGWYDDSKDNRWEAHAKDLENNHIQLYKAGSYNGQLAIKAAHGLGTVNVHYITVDGEELHEVTTMSGVVGNEYTTKSLSFYGYKLVKTEGEVSGNYLSDTIEVTYIYEREQGQIISNYVDVDGNELAESIITTGNVGDEYQTTLKDIIGYKLIKIEGKPVGTIEEETIEVTYIYIKEIYGKGGDVEVLPPQTGITQINPTINSTTTNKNNALITILNNIFLSFILIIKKFI